MEISNLSTVSLVDEFQLWDAILDPESDKPRLQVARSYFQGLQQGDIDQLVEVFRYWKSYPEFLILKATNEKTGEKRGLAVLCSKRGNEVYAHRFKKRLGFLGQGKGVFFEAKDFDVKTIVKTRLLWTTLTFDSKLCSLDWAWRTLSHDFNLWITNLRNKYGKISYVDFPQAFPDPGGKAWGYPHLHIILMFHDHEFQVFPSMEEDDEGRLGLKFRISEKYEVEAQGKWHSFIDVQAISSMAALYSYCKKYCENVSYGDSPEANLNNSMLWLYKKKGYNVSGSFREAYSESIKGLRNSKRIFQKNLFGEVIPGAISDWKYSLVGIRSFFELCKVKKDVDPGQPPPLVCLDESG